MIGVVVVTHGQLATELLNAAETIVGDLPRFTAVSIGWHEDTQDAHEEIAQAIGRVQQGHGVLILTDMFGGTPSNLAMTFLGQDDVEVITGVNLPMLIKLAGLNERATLLTTEFSMTPGAVPMARCVVHDTSAADMARIAARVLTLGTVEEIEQFLSNAFDRSAVRSEVNTR